MKIWCIAILYHFVTAQYVDTRCSVLGVSHIAANYPFLTLRVLTTSSSNLDHVELNVTTLG